MSNVVYIKQDRVLTDSRKLAEMFDKPHDAVLKKIRKHISYYTEQFGRVNFYESNYTNSQGKLQPMYELTQTAFTITALTFPGKKAAALRQAILEEYERMENELRLRKQPVLSLEELLEKALEGIRQRDTVIQHQKDNVVDLVKKVGLSSSRILKEYPKLAKQAQLMKQTLPEEFSLSGALTIYLSSMCGISPQVKRKYGKYLITLFNKSDIDKIERKLK